MIRLLLVILSVSFITACHHGTKPQNCEPKAVQEAQVIMTLDQTTKGSMATLDLADFAHRQ